MTETTDGLALVESIEVTIKDRGLHDDWTEDIPCVVCGRICAGPQAVNLVPVGFAVVAYTPSEENHGWNPAGLLCLGCSDTRTPHLWELAQALSKVEEVFYADIPQTQAEAMLHMTEKLTQDMVQSLRPVLNLSPSS